MALTMAARYEQALLCAVKGEFTGANEHNLDEVVLLSH
jgi:hypothetical protein